MFTEAPGAIPDWVNHTQYLQDIYLKANPKYMSSVQSDLQPRLY